MNYNKYYLSILFSFFTFFATALPPDVQVDPDTLLVLNCDKPYHEVYGYSSSDNVKFAWILPDSTVVDTNAIKIFYGGEYFLYATDTLTGEMSKQRVLVFDDYSFPDFSIDMTNDPPTCGDVLTIIYGGFDEYGSWETPYGPVYAQDVTIYEPGIYTAIVTNFSSGCYEMQSIEVTEDCNYGKVTGTFFYDYNQNQVKDPIEPLMRYGVAQNVYVSPTNETLLAPQGTFYKYMEVGVAHVFDWVSDPDWTLTTNNATVSNPGIANSLTNISYGLYPVQEKHDGYVHIPYAEPRCNTNVTFTNGIMNTGTYDESGKIEVKYDTLVTFVSTDGVHDAAQRTITWNYSDLLPLKRLNIGAMTFLMPDENSIGSALHFESKAYYQSGGMDILLHENVFEPTVHCAFDPNDKQVSPAGIGEYHLTLFGQNLRYRVRFENEGNASATDVIIVDELDADLDFSTLRILNTSHDVQPSIQNGVATFTFENIHLAPEEMGFVEYIISPKGNLPEKTIINNTAKIYFDLNAPIITNTTMNTLVSAIPIVDRTEFCTPYSVHYKAITNNNGVTWNFPGGNPSSSQETDIWVTYEEAGVFETSINYNGEEDQMTITAKDVPETKYNFSFQDMTIITENITTNADQYFWDFGDGTTSTEENPTHMINVTGSYNIVLIAGNECGLDTFSRNLFLTDIEQVDESFSLNLYPNPNDGQFFINVGNDRMVDMNLVVMDVLGRPMYNQTWENTIQVNTEIIVDHLPKGIYHYIFYAGEKVKYGHFSIE